MVLDTPGLRAPTLTAVEEDDEGITLTQDWVEDAANSGLFAALALGRFAGADLGTCRWLARDQLRDRMARVEHRGGWPTLARTTVADVADHLWPRRGRLLDELDALPQVAQHGDPVPGQPARAGRRRRARHRLGARSATAPSAPTSATTCSARGRSSSRCSTPTSSGCPRGWRPARRPRTAPG